MKSRIKNIITSIKKRPKTSILVLLVVIIVLAMVLRGNSSKVEEITVVRGTLVEQVSVSGKTKAAQSVDLSFETSGKVSSAPYGVGERAAEGQVLATIEGSLLLADLAKAEANLEEERVNLERIKNGSAESFVQARENVVQKLKDAYAKTDDAIRNNIDQFFDEPTSSSVELDISFEDGNTEYNFPVDRSLKSEAELLRAALEKSLVAWNSHLATLTPSSSLDLYLEEAVFVLNKTQAFLNTMSLVINSISSTEFTYQNVINGYRANVSSARTSNATAIANLSAAKEKLSESPQDVGGNLDEILAQEARVNQFVANVNSAQAAYARTILRSPIAGIITKQDAKKGQIVTAGETLISVISDKNMEIEANVSEVNIGKVNIGNSVEITLDAFPGKIYTGKVFYIEPAETIIDNVANYKIKVSFDTENAEVKSGLTANLKVQTKVVENVLKIPQYAVFEENGETVIHKIVNGKVEIISIETGGIGTDGMIEVKSGLSEGEVITAELK